MNNKKNISLYVSSLLFGGTERVVSRFANELVEHYNVTLIFIYNKIDYPIHKDVKLICLSDKPGVYQASKFSRTIDSIKCIFKYQKIIREHNIDLSISFLVRQNVINAISKMFNPKLKTIISERCYPSNSYNKFGILMVKLFYNKNDYLFSNSLHINSDLRENFNLKIPAKVIYNPVDIPDKKPNISRFNKETDTFKIISVGRLNPVKNQKSLIKSMSLLSDRFALSFYGIGILEEELKLESESLLLKNRVNFMGSSDKIHEEIVKHHCLVLTSLSEGFPNVILEAMSLGVPVISTNCQSGPLELLNDNEDVIIEEGSFYKAKYGLLVNVDDHNGLAEAIKYYKSNEELRKKHSELSFIKAKQFDISNITLQLRELIENCLCAE